MRIYIQLLVILTFIIQVQAAFATATQCTDIPENRNDCEWLCENCDLPQEENCNSLCAGWE